MSNPPALQRLLTFQTPYDWEGILGFLRQRNIPGVEEVGEDYYRRTVSLAIHQKKITGWIQVEPAAQVKDKLLLTISPKLERYTDLILPRVECLFDLHCDPKKVQNALGDLGIKNPGLRAPGAFSGFEVAVRAILGQQITVKAARTLASRVAEKLGKKIETPYSELNCDFPSAQEILDTSPEVLGKLGIYRSRVTAIRSLAEASLEKRIYLEPDAETISPEEQIERLKELPGIGDWTAHYIAMRALAWSDAFPAADYGVLKALEEKSPARARRLAEQWRPYRAYAVMHLWHSLK